MRPRRLFPEAEMPLHGELFEQLLQTDKLRIERILSAPGSSSGPCNQDQDEWVLLLQGHAALEVEGEQVNLSAGEALFLPTQTPHRVLDTSQEPPCIWLAVHIEK